LGAGHFWSALFFTAISVPQAKSNICIVSFYIPGVEPFDYLSYPENYFCGSQKNHELSAKIESWLSL